MTRASTRVRAIMSIVNHMYSEKELKTEIYWDVKEIIHQRGQKWCKVAHFEDLVVKNFPDGKLATIARNSALDVNAYVFLTGSNTTCENCLGISHPDKINPIELGTICDSDKGKRVSLSKFVNGNIKGKDAYTAEVRLKRDPRACFYRCSV